MTGATAPAARIGVAIVTFNAADVIRDCLESLLAAAAADGVSLRIVVIDNASTDGTPALIRAWAAGAEPYAPPGDIPFALAPVAKPVALAESGSLAPGGGIALIEAGVNGGFAAGVNLGLAALFADPGISHVWVLNPDTVTPPGTPARILAALRDRPDCALIGHRLCYVHQPDCIQIDGGTISWMTGVTGNIGLGQSHAATPPPDPALLDFIMGGSMIAARAFYEAVGPMREDYFLYYEEVDWACRRGALPLGYATGALVYHRAGTAIGSPTLDRLASPFSLYFKHRGRMRFVRRFNPAALPVAWAYGMAKIAQMLLQYRALPEAWATFAAIHGLPPPARVRARLSPEAARLAFGR
jgi:GT2 family glycosyltransferase